jgi:hypothetical protein
MSNSCLKLNQCNGARLKLFLPTKLKLQQLICIYKNHCAYGLTARLEKFEELTVEEAVGKAAMGRCENRWRQTLT